MQLYVVCMQFVCSLHVVVGGANVLLMIHILGKTLVHTPASSYSPYYYRLEGGMDRMTAGLAPQSQKTFGALFRHLVGLSVFANLHFNSSIRCFSHLIKHTLFLFEHKLSNFNLVLPTILISFAQYSQRQKVVKCLVLCPS